MVMTGFYFYLDCHLKDVVRSFLLTPWRGAERAMIRCQFLLNTGQTLRFSSVFGRESCFWHKHQIETSGVIGQLFAQSMLIVMHIVTQSLG